MLFSVVSRETILSHAMAGAEEAEDIGAFKSAVVAACEAPALAANLLFQVRSSQLLFGGSASAARERISGTLIGLEMAAGLAGGRPGSGITLVASGRLGMLYRLAFETLSIAVRSVSVSSAPPRRVARSLASPRSSRRWRSRS